MIHVHDSVEAVSAAAAKRVVDAARRSIDRSGRFNLCLSGGSTPEGLYRTLTREPSRSSIDWKHVHIYFGDERAVPPSEPDSNFRMAGEVLVEVVEIPPSAVHRMHGEMPDLAAAVLEYESHLVEPMDLVVLGMGEDGHTASIFPGSPLVNEKTRRVAFVVDAPKPPSRRLTVTPRVFDEARDVFVLVIGASKAPMVARALEQQGPPLEVPARLLREYDWYLDRAAASRLQTVSGA